MNFSSHFFSLSPKKLSRVLTRLFALVILSIIAGSLYLIYHSPLVRSLYEQKPFFALLIGTDLDDGVLHTDVLILARYLPKSQSLDLFFIPKDTRVQVPGTKIKRINEVYNSALMRHSGDENFARAELFSALRDRLFVSTSSEIAFPKLEHYAQFNYAQFQKWIDLLNGVSVPVDEPMHYDDSWGKLHIHFDPGSYWMHGKEALEYVRFRGENGDYGRLLRQQSFLVSVIERLKVPANFMRLPYIFSRVHLQSNLTYFERLWFMLELKNLKISNVHLIQLPGRLSQNSWGMDPESAPSTVRLLNAQDVHSYRKILSDDAHNRPTVEVWNASGKKGVALEAVRTLRQHGFDVVKWGNYPTLQRRSSVHDRKGNYEDAVALAQALGREDISVYTRIESNPLIDIEVILGETFVSNIKE